MTWLGKTPSSYRLELSPPLFSIKKLCEAPGLRALTNNITLKTFEELGVSEEIRRAIEELGFEHPMPVQEEVIPFLLGNGNDVISLAQTGTGKTAAFGIPLLQRTDPTSRRVYRTHHGTAQRCGRGDGYSCDGTQAQVARTEE